VLPALTAVLAGALVAGTATLFGGSGAGPGADGTTLNVSLSDNERTPDARGDLERPTPGSATGGAPEPPPAPTTSAAPPTTTSETVTSEPPPPPPPPVTEEPAPPPASPRGSQADQVVTLVNSVRQDAGCGPVTANAQLTTAAQGHASDMSNRDYFSHSTPEGVTFDQRIRNAGYDSPGAENIARGAQTAEDVMQMWMDSDGHRRNILNCDLDTIGVGLDTDGFYWVQNFGY
jgi:uncharacterized protein YkwD